MIEFVYPPTEHANGDIEYRRLDGDWKYPREIPGYVRDKENPWKLVSEWNPCVHRQRRMRQLSCGQAALDHHCNCDGCPLKGHLLRPNDCDFCEHALEE